MQLVQQWTASWSTPARPGWPSVASSVAIRRRITQPINNGLSITQQLTVKRQRFINHLLITPHGSSRHCRTAAITTAFEKLSDKTIVCTLIALRRLSLAVQSGSFVYFILPCNQQSTQSSLFRYSRAVVTHNHCLSKYIVTSTRLFTH